MLEHVYTILASGARTSSGVSSVLRLPPHVKAVAFLVDLTAAALEASDTLDIYIQESIDGGDGSTWNDRVHFAQMLGNGSTHKYQALLNCESEPEAEVAAISDAALAVSTVNQGPLCSPIRVKYVIVDGDADADQSFTFSVKVQVVT